MAQPGTQLEFPVIPHALEGKLIQQRAADGYLNATAMCDAAGKQMSHYIALKSTKEFIAELSADTKIPADMLIITIQGGKAELQGTWIHPQVAINLGQWLSPKFAVQVAKWVYEWMAGGSAETKAKLPAHIQRYMVNRMEIPATHFSMLNEMTFGVIAPLEVQGYSVPPKLMPDISQGKMFSDWLRKEKGIDPATFPTYKHQFIDGRPTVDARLYPNELLADFRKHLNEVWIPKRMEAYFAERDERALPYLPKLLALAAPK